MTEQDRLTARKEALLSLLCARRGPALQQIVNELEMLRKVQSKLGQHIK